MPYLLADFDKISFLALFSEHALGTIKETT